MRNPTLLQCFHWYYPEGGKLWPELAERADGFNDIGINMVWLPPAYKGASGGYSVGYDSYDLFDLGEFDQKGSIPTKYGDKVQLLAAIDALKRNDIAVLLDVVVNHKMGADEKEAIRVQRVNADDRTQIDEEIIECEGWTRYTFPARAGQYSQFIWDFKCFSGIDHIENPDEDGIFKIVNVQKVSAASPLTQKPDQARRRFRLGMLVFFGMLGWALLTAMNQPKLGLAMLFGVGFGLLIERAQICFTSAFRDMWITGRTHMAKAIIIGMAVSAIGIFSYVQLGVEPKIMWAGPNAVIGGLLFGFGIVLAGGCETGWMYRAVEGQVHYWWVGLGNVIGSTILAYYWDDFAPALATDWDKINLLKTFGPMGGLLVTYLLLFAALMLIIGWEKRFFRRAAPQTAKEIA
ncbi:YeeE/YedE thiosulfate transporter family protein [Escherichia coli]|nr:YeeE/YedE thiosulfate transporter family protein [Escherichia coli]